MFVIIFNFVFGGVFFKIDGRKILSEAKFKRREEKLLAEVPKLDEFFKPKSREPKSSTSTAHESIETDRVYPNI